MFARAWPYVSWAWMAMDSTGTLSFTALIISITLPVMMNAESSERCELPAAKRARRQRPLETLRPFARHHEKRSSKQ